MFEMKKILSTCVNIRKLHYVDHSHIPLKWDGSVCLIDVDNSFRRFASKINQPIIRLFSLNLKPLPVQVAVKEECENAIQEIR